MKTIYLGNEFSTTSSSTINYIWKGYENKNTIVLGKTLEMYRKEGNI